MSLHIFGRLLNSEEPIPHDDLVTLNKLLVEGTPAQLQIGLGWLIDTYYFTIALPNEKYESWSHQIMGILKQLWASYDELDIFVGRLNYAAFVIPLSRHFLGHVR